MFAQIPEIDGFLADVEAKSLDMTTEDVVFVSSSTSWDSSMHTAPLWLILAPTGKGVSESSLEGEAKRCDLRLLSAEVTGLHSMELSSSGEGLLCCFGGVKILSGASLPLQPIKELGEGLLLAVLLEGGVGEWNSLPMPNSLTSLL